MKRPRGRRRRRLRRSAAVLAACGLAALGLWWAASGGGPAETVRVRVATSVLIFLAAGSIPRLVLGRERGRSDWLLVPLVASGPLVLGLTGVALAFEGGRAGADLPLAVLYLVGPAALASAGWAVADRLALREASLRPPRS